MKMEEVLSYLGAPHHFELALYLDDLLVHAGNFEGALRHLREVFAAIRQAGLCLNLKKCQLFRRETAFLGHVVSAGSVVTDPAKITAVRDWPPPTNVSDLRSFLGLASYYRRYVQDFVTIARPLHHLTDCGQAFNALQTALITAPVLAYPDANWPFILDTDASKVTMDSRHRLGRQHGNREHCPRQEAWAQLAPTVATRQTVDGEAGCLPLYPAQVQEAQECDAALTHVQSWLLYGNERWK
ncbi:hypothetical protein AAFF_G00322650 [Aldrovandia affinis]|uniref:ribonuclease H n=1 Tax=Aldrovandia affinis TaxID=143900 RepID=A0AAD7SMG6_9TELE|nr:hypothetical protein AAFF_G00322650 [Aldrovandia affinis]